MLNVLEADTKDFQKVVNNILIEVKPMILRGKISDDFLGYVNELRKQIADLEAKLAEKQKFIDALHLDKNEIILKLINFYKLSEENYQLKQRLAEKEKEIEDARDVSRRLIRTCGTVNCYGKNQTAIAELEKVKELARKRIEQLNSMEDKTISVIATGLACVWFIDQIDQQIKEIKGER